MSIQGGGGSKPPGPPPGSGQGPVHKGKGKAVRASQHSAGSHNQADQRAKRAAKDGFTAKGRAKDAVANVRRVDEIIARMPTTSSGIENMVKILEATRAQIADEHALLKDQAASIVGRLVEAGFSGEAMSGCRDELNALRRRMAALRKRLGEIHRRLKVAFSSAGKLGYANLAQRLGAQMERVRKLEPGVQRSLFALELASQLYGKGGEPGIAVLRAPMAPGGPLPKASVASYLAAIAPSGAIARRAAAMLTGGPSHAVDATSLPMHQALHDRARARGADTTLDAFAAFHDALR